MRVALAKKVLGLILCLAGLALAFVGAWFGLKVGASGTATFTTHTDGRHLIVVEPGLSARLTTPLTVTVRSAPGSPLWLGTASPADARAVLRAVPATSVTGVDIGGWSLRTSTTGSGTVRDLSGYDVWRTRTTATGTASALVRVEADPPTVVVDGRGKPMTVTLQWTRERWFIQSLVTFVVGLVLLAVGVTFLRSRGPVAAAPSSGRSPR